MRSMNLFNLAALVASVMVLAIAAVLIPDKLWSDATITSVVMFAFAVVFVFYAPSVISKSQTTNDAAQIAAIGPLGILSGGMLLLTAGAFVFAILGRERMAWAMNIFSCGSFVISLLMLRAASNVVGTVVAHDVAPSKHIIWQSEIQSIGSFAKNWGYGGLCMANLFAFRATKPSDMMQAHDPIGPDNDEWLKKLTYYAGVVVAAWGNGGTYLGRSQAVLTTTPNLMCLKLNKSGQPSHPLYQAGSSLPKKIASFV